MPVPVLDLKRQYQEIKNEVAAAVAEVFENQHFILGKNGAELEKECAEFLGAAETVGCASGTDAILLSLKALDLQPGEGVITSSFTFFATAGAIHNAKGVPFFVDIEPVTFNMDPVKLKEFLATECEKGLKGVVHKKTGTPIKGILPVHLYGASCEMDEIMAIAKDHGLFVLEDSCQAFGSKYKGKRVGTFGELSAFSFFPTKNLGGAGDGGLVSTGSADLAKRLRKIRVHGSEKRYYHDEIGYNSRLDEIQAAVLRIKLRHLDKWNEKRRGAAGLYASELSKIEGVVAPSAPSHIEHIYHQYVIRAERRDALKDYLDSKGVGSMIYYPVPLHQQVCFEFLGYRKGDLPETEKAADEVLALPIFAELTESEIKEAAREIGNFYSGKK
ncbi:MAG TPA: DegT/DnrJ/EryC1/StrS family aminotransferase [Acidobacteriota bacterium]|jgi:dTDP-4-amino-4,6-dideoxygalactose transaminase|nr:DegT/DnrJ/EryC1/StrS family aminotransferase [Acidobacteriota bacterium]HNT17570.1 DegT/DnrJ/EryC1/StrS family aminotransferase [Acidobacteriota bacterium]HPA26967.1 DegT/DnrJ/EryC1/StrS family aminotransferase [Acidobacteriota bacterium]HQO19687.1 DegT/DnrJ/EryC1/StrS family aminotransferase [Acidobacteriota bacterium]HQQ46544.1 DegT/DnrJ/EryC1/StrS family aminotransferase [Acidobacteriota bacterium]